MRILPLSLSLLFALASLSLPVSAQDKAETRYSDIYPMIATQHRVNELDRIESILLVASNDDTVPPEDIVLTLDDGEQTHRFAAENYGVIDLPLREDWRQAGFVLVSNQPKDTMKMSITLTIQLLPALKVEYAWLWETRQQMEQALGLMARAEGANPEVSGLRFRHRPGVPAKAWVLSEDETIEFVVDKTGAISMPLDGALLKENPMVEFSPMPSSIQPLMEQ